MGGGGGGMNIWLGLHFRLGMNYVSRVLLVDKSAYEKQC